MPSDELHRIVDAVIETINDGDLSDQHILKLYAVVPETVVTGAFNLLDRESVIKYSNPFTYPRYEILGSTDIYTVFLDMTVSSTPFYCSCPAFSYAVLSSESHLMCKHVLATRLANKLGLFIEHPMTVDDLQSMMVKHFQLDSPGDQAQESNSGLTNCTT